MKHPAVFLDRDGTLSEEIGYMTDPSKLVLIQGAAEALKQLSNAGFRLVVVTNQSGISRGYFGLKELLLANERLESLFFEKGVTLDGIYACPHGPVFGCACRKPLPALLIEAALDHGIDFRRSFVVGDKLTDVELGWRLAIPSVLLLTGFGRAELAKMQKNGSMRFRPDMVASDILEASKWILNRVP